MPGYFLFVALVGVAVHAIGREYPACTVGTAVISSIFNLIHEAALAQWEVNPGWALPLFFVGLLYALPVSALVGLPFLALRRLRRSADAKVLKIPPPDDGTLR